MWLTDAQEAVEIRIPVRGIKRINQKRVAKIVHCGLPQDFLKLLCLVCQTIAPASFGRTEHFRRGHQEKVAKIVQCGETWVEKE